jgi:hypothetical protein
MRRWRDTVGSHPHEPYNEPNRSMRTVRFTGRRVRGVEFITISNKKG